MFPREKKTGGISPTTGWDSDQNSASFLDEKDCRCFITGLETELESGTSNNVGGMTVVTSGPVRREGKKAEKNEFGIFSAR